MNEEKTKKTTLKKEEYKKQDINLPPFPFAKFLMLMGIIMCLILLIYFRNHILYPGVSKIKIVSVTNGVSKLTIPNEMIPKYRRPVYGEVQRISINLNPNLSWGRSSKYLIVLYPNGNNNAILRLALPSRIASMNEVKSEFEGYRKYIRGSGIGDIISFMLVTKQTTNEAVFIQCYQGYKQQLKKCSYYGVYDDKLSYEISFPGVELGDLKKLIIYAEIKITDLLDKE